MHRRLSIEPRKAASRSPPTVHLPAREQRSTEPLPGRPLSPATPSRHSSDIKPGDRAVRPQPQRLGRDHARTATRLGRDHARPASSTAITPVHRRPPSRPACDLDRHHAPPPRRDLCRRHARAPSSDTLHASRAGDPSPRATIRAPGVLLPTRLAAVNARDRVLASGFM